MPLRAQVEVAAPVGSFMRIHGGCRGSASLVDRAAPQAAGSRVHGRGSWTESGRIRLSLQGTLHLLVDAFPCLMMNGLMQRTIVVGDVHGCLDELQALLHQCGVVRGDRVVLAGDLVAKGRTRAGSCNWRAKWGALAVLGNHMTTASTCGTAPAGETRRPRRWSLDTLDEADWAFLESLPLFVRLGPEGPGGPESVVVHAGVVPGVPLEEQERDSLLSLRSMVGGTAPTRRLLMRWPWPRPGMVPSTSCSGTMRFVVCSNTPWPPGWTRGACTVASSQRWSFPAAPPQGGGAAALCSGLSMLSCR